VNERRSDGKGKPGGKNDASLPQKKMERTEAMKSSFSFTARTHSLGN